MTVAVVTGATSGIGLEVARLLAARGEHVLALGRDPHRLRAVPPLGGEVLFVPGDLLTRRGVERAAAAVLRETGRVDRLVHAAGALYWAPTLTADGAEANVALHHLAPFGLTRLLRPALEGAPGARVLLLGSVTHRGVRDLPGDALDFGRPSLAGYTALGAFARAKLLSLLAARAWSGHLAGTGVSVAAFAPPSTHTEGFFSPTMPGWLRRLRPVSRVLFAPAPRVAGTAVGLLRGGEWSPGEFYGRTGRPAPTHPLARDPEWAERVWRASEAWWAG